MKRFVKFWVSKADLPLIVLAFVYLGIYSGQVLLPEYSPAQATLDLSSLVIYWIFALDLGVRLVEFATTEKSQRSLRQFLISNAISIIALAAPAFRSLRIFRLVLVLRGVMNSSIRRAERATTLVLTSFPIVLYTSAIAVLDCERGAPNSNITNLGDAIWWAGITMTTVGYGDLYPVTVEGRLIASGLLLSGIAILSTITAIVSRWIFGEDQKTV